MITKDQRPCVVVVDEHEDSRQAMQRALAANGYDVKSAGTVKEALYIIERYGCDLLISDMLLPDGTAVDLLRSLADAHEAPKAIAMTDNTSFKERSAAAEAGFTAFVSKPVMFTQLLTEVDRVLAH
jgi:DNA-binding NtrC family response regulator